MNNGRSIHDLVLEGNVAEVALLLAADPSLIDSQDDDEATPLHVAAQCGNVEIARLLITHGANVNSVNPKWKYTPLHQAANEAIAELLINNGADIEARGWMGATPLIDAASCDLGVVRCLIAHGADVAVTRPERFDTPLHFADEPAIIELLINSGAPVGAKDCFEATPLHWSFYDPERVAVFLRHQADVNARDDNGRTPFFKAASEADAEVSANLIPIYLEAGADFRVTDSKGYTPLHEAAGAGNLTTIRLLLAAGADPRARTNIGETPRHTADRKKHDAVAAFLLELEANSTAARDPNDTSMAHTFVQRLLVMPGTDSAIAICRYGELALVSLSEEPRKLNSVLTDHAGLNAAAISPDGAEIALGPQSKPWLELRRTTDLSIIESIPIEPERSITAVAYSPDGRWLAFSQTGGHINLIERGSGRVATEWPGGERTLNLLFHPSSEVLFSACSFQGGGYVQIDRVAPDGQLRTVGKLHRSNTRTEPYEFVDTLVDLACTSGGDHLVLFETSAIYHDYHMDGWRGNIVAFAPKMGGEIWQVSVDGDWTEDFRTLVEAGHPMGYFGEILILEDELVVCGTTGGYLLFYVLRDGQFYLSEQVHPTSDVVSLACAERKVWVVLANGELRTLAL